MRQNNLRKLIGIWPNFPKEGIIFRDINPLLRDAEGLVCTIKRVCGMIESAKIDLVAGIEARGFVIASLVAMAEKKGLVLVRKAGKLPGPVISEPYDIEYGSAVLEVQKDSVKTGQRILIVDDVIATGGTAIAAANLFQRLGGTIVGYAFVMNLKKLGGSARLSAKGFKVHYIWEYE